MSGVNNIVSQVGRNQTPQCHTDVSVSLIDSGRGKKSTRCSKERRRRNSKQLFIATYNAQTLRQDQRFEGLEQELQHIKWNILGLSEMRRSGEQCTTLRPGHLFYYKNSINNSHLDCVGFHRQIKHLVIKIQTITERVAYIVMKLSKRYKLHVIKVYPTSTADDEEIL